MDRLLVSACANPRPLDHAISDVAGASRPAVLLHVSRPRSSYTSGINGEHRASPLPMLLPLAAACLFSASSASAVDTDTTRSLVDGFLSQEPANALSLPTWTIHVASVVEWIIAMGLVWRFGDDPKNSAWKGLTWGMVPLLGGAMCACAWHFFYNAESLEILVVIQAALTMIGNFTMWLAAYRIYRSSTKSS